MARPAWRFGILDSRVACGRRPGIEWNLWQQRECGASVLRVRQAGSQPVLAAVVEEDVTDQRYRQWHARSIAKRLNSALALK